MRLTSLEIKGFKSFADKTIIHINQDITGVVGPNGSGKSNVVDAIRWVLGEQRTSQLRSEKMDNLIFNGSKHRKPSGFAEVILNFENNKGLLSSDYNQISISRILHRSGESEYRLNGVSCRLKDITNLFLDTGISNDSYAIIELGMIDEILNDREHSRRKLFEQAAGIAKFKYRKKETLGKLNATDADLSRVEDLLFEIGNNLKTLEAQAKKAEKYYAFKEEYKLNTLELSKFQVQRYVTSFKELKEKIETQTAQTQTLVHRIEKIENELESEKQQLLSKEAHLSERQKMLNNLLNESLQRENQKNIIEEKIKFLQEKIVNIGTQVENAKFQIQQLENKKSENQIRVTNQAELVIQLEQEVKLCNENLEGLRNNHQDLKNHVEKLLKERVETEKKVYELEKKISVSLNQKENLLKIVEQNKTEISGKALKLSELKAEYDIVEENKIKAVKELDMLKKQEDDWQKNIDEATSKIEQLKLNLANTNRSLDAKSNAFNLNKSLIENLEGFPESIRFLKKSAKNIKTNNAPLLSDIFYCQEKYRIAIENYLEPFLNYFILENSHSATEAIEILSDAGKGRAHFFILDNFKTFTPKPANKNPHAIRAIDLIEVDAQYKPLADFLLENVWIIEDVNFKEICIQLQQFDFFSDAILLSVNGKYVKSPFSFSGGAIGLFEGMRIGRVKNQEKLQKEIEKLEKQKNEVEQILKQASTHLELLRTQTLKNKINEQNLLLNAINNKATSIVAGIENLQNFVNENQQKNIEISERINNLEKELEAAQIHYNEAKTNAQHFHDKYAVLQNEFDQATSQLNTNATLYNEKNIYFYQQQNLLHQLQQEASFLNQQTQEIDQRNSRNDEEIKTAQKKLIEHKNQILSITKEIQSLFEQRNDFSTALSSAEKNYYDARKKITDQEDALRKEQKAKQQTDLLELELREKNTELKILLNALKERLSIEFNIGINDIIDQAPNLDFNEEELKQKVQQLKEKIERFGEVNPMAMEAYNEMKERNDFIFTQRDDLLKAKHALLNTMNELENSAKDKFLDAFSQARQNFIKVFRSLFTEEDNCDIRLADPSQPLDSKIEIIAQPKGKKPQVIDQLSGGEKTLTALAILFALYLLKPAPFCILDEVDAPLDDANIGKFNKMIREFSTNSQFILITHNKNTMAEVDVIYGVTMQEMGISKVVSVDFKDLKLAEV